MTRINPNEMYDDTTTVKSYHATRNFRQSAKFFTLTSTEGKMEVVADTPDMQELIGTLQKLEIPMLTMLEPDMIEELVALQASNGLKLKTAYGQDVLVLKANSVEQVGRKIAKMLMNI